jgi:uncharacterized membrane protein
MLYLVNVTVHVLAALVWLGGMFFLALVGAPVLRQVEDHALRARLVAELGLRFRSVGWACIAVLVVTGVLNLYFRGLLSAAGVGSPGFWASQYGHSLAWKLGAVAAMLTVSAVHDFVDGPAASRARPGSEEARRLRKRAALLARLNAVLGVVAVVAAVRLARGM